MNGENTINASRHFILNDAGGVTYTPSMQPSQDSGRNLLLADVRVLVAATQDLSQAHRECWPHPYPVPADVHCALLAADYAMARVRGGALRRLAEQDFPALGTRAPADAGSEIERLHREKEQLHSLLAEWEEGVYDGPDFLRRVRLALHGDTPMRVVPTTQLRCAIKDQRKAADARGASRLERFVGHRR
jgi:hypothetical protein